MAENTRMKELNAEVKKNTDDLQKLYHTMTERMDRLEAANSTKLDNMHIAQQATDATIQQISDSLKALLQKAPHTTTHGGPASSKTPFQVRNVKLEFPRFMYLSGFLGLSSSSIIMKLLIKIDSPLVLFI